MRLLRPNVLKPMLLAGLAGVAGLAGLPLPGTAQAQTAEAPAKPAVPLRLFVDLQCPHTRAAWPRYHAALQRHGGELYLHHLPLARHPLAREAALAALAARKQGKEHTFVDAVLRGPEPDAAALAAAAQTAGLDIPRWERDRADPALQKALDSERQRVAALGIRATPAALIGGRGWSGVPAEALLEAMWRRAQREAAAARREAGPQADTERMVLARQTPAFVDALDQLRGSESRSGSGPGSGATPIAQLGSRWQVRVPAPVPTASSSGLVRVVVWFDPAQPGDWRLVQAWQALARTRPALQVVALPAIQPDAASSRGGLWYAAAVLQRADRAALLPALLDPTLAVDERWSAALAKAGLDAAAATTARDQPKPAEWLAQVALLAAQTDAQPGAVFLAGHRWWGKTDDAGPALSWLSGQAEARRKQGMSPAQVLDAAVAGGRLRDPAEAELQAPLPAAGLDAWPALAPGGPEVSLLLEPDSMHARAAWYVLRRTVAGKPIPTQLRVALVGKRGGCRSPQADAVLAAAKLGVGPAMLDAVLDAHKPLTPPQLAAVAARAGVPAARWQAALADAPALRAAANAACALRDLHADADLPLIVVGDRRYTGRIDETALVHAIRVSLANPQ